MGHRFEDEDFATRGYAKGYVGPQGFEEDVVVFADPSVRAGANWVTGANRPDTHLATRRATTAGYHRAFARAGSGDPHG